MDAPPSLSSLTQNPMAFSPRTPFSDQSHAQFYGSKALSPSSKLLRFEAPSPLPSDPRRPKRAMVSLQAVLSNASMHCEPAIEQNLMKELADLKLQMKQKKKELKAQMEERKKSMKAEGKKTMKKKKVCSSESSSSSESSDCDCESVVSMGLLTRRTEVNGADLHTQADLEKMDDAGRSALRVPAVAGGQASAESAPAGAHKIEVCMGGKCKRAGSEQLLLALRGQIPDASSVDALPCKCMGKCAMGINVRVQMEDTNPQHHCHVSVKDAGLILSHHFGLGRPPTRLPSLGQAASTLPQHLVLV